VWLWGQGPKGVHHPEAAEEEREEGAKDKEDPDEEAYEAKPGEAAPSKSSAQDPEHLKESTKERQADQEGGNKQESDSDAAGTEESSDEGSEDSGDDSKEESKDESDSKGGDKTAERKLSDDGYELPGPNAPGQINYKTGSDKGPGERQKGTRPPPELKGEKDVSVQSRSIGPRYANHHQSHHDSSGAYNPYIEQNKEEKSKKGGSGVTESAKIHGTVDTRGPSR